MTATLPYVHDVADVPRLLHLVEKATTPRIVTARHLAANGFDEAAADQLRAFLEALGLVSSDGTPSDAWTSYQAADEREETLAAAVRAAYAPFFGEDGAVVGDDETLTALAQGSAGVDDAVLVVATFGALCGPAGIARGVTTATTRSRRGVLQDVSTLLQVSVAEFDTARQCLHHDLMRPAFVSAWNSYVALAFAHLSADDFAAFRISARRADLGVGELMRLVHGGELIRLLVQHHLVTADDQAQLEDLLRQRNDCADPMTFAPDRTETAAYLSAILTRSASLTERPIA